jgi:hypothetical protein
MNGPNVDSAAWRDDDELDALLVTARMLVLHGGGPFMLHARLASGSDAEESGRNEDPGT